MVLRFLLDYFPLKVKMLTRIWLNESPKKTLLGKTVLCLVNLEVVPGGTYIVDGIPYKLVDKPTFVISGRDRDGVHHLNHVELTVEEIPEGI